MALETIEADPAPSRSSSRQPLLGCMGVSGLISLDELLPCADEPATGGSLGKREPPPARGSPPATAMCSSVSTAAGSGGGEARRTRPPSHKQRSLVTPLTKQQQAASLEARMRQAFNFADVEHKKVLSAARLGRALDRLGILGDLQQADLELRVAGCHANGCNWQEFKAIAREQHQLVLLERSLQEKLRAAKGRPVTPQYARATAAHLPSPGPPTTNERSYKSLGSAVLRSHSSRATGTMTNSASASWILGREPPPRDLSITDGIKPPKPRFRPSTATSILRERDQMKETLKSIASLPNIVSHNSVHIGGSYLYDALQLSMVGPKLLPRQAMPRNFIEIGCKS
ncbi:hypothetical protein AB1Y20_013991 [Prymnesium parvum]|uniref:EF-hand domain-containing protein n=1 Tax=Prymnesium parvum TaxID=97485 RepID=A0AB34IEV2_PRYPA